MNYYERNMGNYAKKTMHLSMLEHGAYNLLLDRYYVTEKGIEQDEVYRYALAREKRDRDAVDKVLKEFFELENGRWVHVRCEEEIAKVRTKAQIARENGKNGGRPKNNPEETQKKPSGFSVGYENETQTKAPQSSDHSKSPISDDIGADGAFDQQKAIDPAKLVYDNGKTLLARYGVNKSQQGALITGWRAEIGDEALLQIIAEAGKAERAEIIAYIAGCVRNRIQGRSSAAPSGPHSISAAADRLKQKLVGAQS